MNKKIFNNYDEPEILFKYGILLKIITIIQLSTKTTNKSIGRAIIGFKLL